MKKIVYLFAAAFIAIAIVSCDKNGNLMDGSPEKIGIEGPRYLYQEYNSIDTLAEYHYDGIRLSDVVGQNNLTKLTYNGDLVNEIQYGEFDGVDSTSYTQYFTYNPSGTKVVAISELRTIFRNSHADPAPPTPVIDKYKSFYDLSYEPVTGRLSKIVQRNGQEMPGVTFSYDNYRTVNYEYEAGTDNIKTAILDVGTYSAGNYGPSLQQVVYNYLNYDKKVSPYTLLPFAYKVSKAIANPLINYQFSPNNPQKISITTDTMPIPIEYEATYFYDPQDYALSGFGSVLYDYRPF